MSGARKGKNGGKIKFWRKMSVKTYDGSTEIRHGRTLRNALRGMNHQGMLLPIHVLLFRSAGIATPALDKAILGDDTDITTREGVEIAA